MKRALPHLVFALALGALAATFVHLFWVLRQPPTPLETKLAEADRVLYYRLDGDTGATFRLSGAEKVIKILSHAVVAEPKAAGRVDYGISLELVSKVGERLWHEELYTSSRQSRANEEDGVWLKQNAFSLQAGIEITDDRLLLVHLPEEIPVDSELRLSRRGPVEEVLVRLYVRRARTAEQRRRELQALDPSRRDELIARTTAAPWVLVPPWERSERVRFRFDRIAAIGEADIDFRTRAIWYTGFREPLPNRACGTEGGHAGHELSAAQSLSFDVAGLDAITVEPVGARPAGAAMTIAILGARLPERNEFVAGAEPLSIDLDDGAMTARIESSSAAPLAVRVTGRMSGAPRDRQLTPDWVKTRGFFVGPGDSPLVVPVVAPDTPWGRAFKLSVRAVGEPADRPAVALAPTATGRELIVSFDDAAGRSLSRLAVPVEGTRSTFERVVFSDGRAGAVSEAMTLPVEAPAESAALRIDASGGPLLVRAFAYAPPLRDDAGSDRDGPPPPPDGYRWKFTRDKSEVWFPLAPEDRRDLADAGREIVLEGQRRLVRD